MFGLSRKKAPRPEARPEPAAFETMDTPDETADALSQSFRVLEIATLTLDGIAHGLAEARSLARSAARPDGSAQRGLIAARYAVLKDDIERRSAEQALDNGDRIAIALGAGEDGRQGSLVTRALPSCAFRTAQEARALAAMMEEALRAVEEEAARIRDAAGHVADSIAKNATPNAAKPPIVATPTSRSHAA